MSEDRADLELKVLRKRVEEKRLAEDSVRPEPTMTKAESGISGLAQGLTFGFADEIAGGLRAGVDKVAGKAAQFVEGAKEDPSPPIGELYRKYQQEQQDHVNKASSDNFKTFLGANIGGAMVAPGGAAFAPVKGAKTIANMGKVAAGGALYGAGASEARPLESPEQLGKFAGDVGTGAALGAAAQYGFDKLGKAVGFFAPENLKKFAQRRAYAATAPTPGDRKTLAKFNMIEDTGKELLDKKIVTARASLTDIQERATKEAANANKVIGDTISQIDGLIADAKKLAPSDEVRKAIDDRFQFGMDNIGEKIRKRLIEPNKAIPNLEAEVAKLEKLAASYETKGKVSLATGQLNKTSQRKVTKFGSESVPQAFQRDVYQIIKEEMGEVVSRVADLRALVSIPAEQFNKEALAREFAKQLNLSTQRAAQKGNLAVKGGSAFDDFVDAFKSEIDDEIFLKPVANSDETLKKYLDANRTSAIMNKAANNARDRLAVQEGQRQFSLTDNLMFLAGMANGGLPDGVILGVLNKIARKYGPSTQAVTANNLANLIEKTPGGLKAISEGGYKALTSGGATTGTVRGIQEGLKIPERQRDGLRLPRR